MTIEDIKSKVRDSRGVRRTVSLFDELIGYKVRENGIKPIYTFKEIDIPEKGLKSAHKIYMECADPSEYKAAMALVGSWDHWLRLLENKAILKEIECWREELEIKLRSEAIESLRQVATNEGVKGQQAMKWLAEGRWKGTQRGRPTNEEVQRERRVQAGINDDLKSDASRILKLVSG